MERTASTALAIRLDGLTKQFGSGTDAAAVAGMDLEIRDGEFFSLLGPSGSGKTTTLRMIAGFERPTAGRIYLHGDDVTDLPPFDRDVNTVFQDYALFPHMSVADNVGYGLEVRKVGASERATRVKEALRMVRLEGYDARRPAQLSGGLLAFALSFDEVIVTLFAAGPGARTLPVWVYSELQRSYQLPVVNVVALLLVLVSVVPVWIAQRIGGGEITRGGR